MQTQDSIKKRKTYFMSCFICRVAIDDDFIELIDSSNHSFYIDTHNSELMAMFKNWFVNVYEACIPQTLTVVQYDIMSKDNEPVMVVKKLIHSKSSSKKTLCESANEKAM